MYVFLLYSHTEGDRAGRLPENFEVYGPFETEEAAMAKVKECQDDLTPAAFRKYHFHVTQTCGYGRTD